MAARTALLRALGRRDEHAAIELLRRGASPHQRDAYGQTVLHLAAAAGLVEVVHALAAAGADVGVLASRSRTSPLRYAVQARQSRTVEALLQCGADAEDGGGGWSPLMEAAALGDAPTARALIRAGAALDRRDPTGRTALAVALLRPSNSPASHDGAPPWDEDLAIDVACLLLTLGAELPELDGAAYALLMRAVDELPP